MATWHQQRARARLWHETQWTVVEDPPNALCTLARFTTRAEAEAFLAARIAHGGVHLYIVRPATEDV